MMPPFFILCFLNFLVYFGAGMLSPILPIYARDFGVSVTEVGFIMTSWALARIFFDLPAGYFTHHYGIARTLFIAFVITVISSAMIGIVNSFWLLVFWRFWQGVGSALYTTPALSGVADLSPKERLARNIALFQGFHHLGMSFGPSLGGFLAERMGYRLLFFSYSGLIALGMLMIPWGLRLKSKPQAQTPDEKVPVGPEDHPKKGWSDWKTMSRLLSSRAFILIAAVEFIIFFARNGGQFTIVPLLGTHSLNLKVGQIGLTLTLVAVSQLSILYLAGWLSDRFGVTKVLIPGILVASLSYFLFAASRDYLSFLSAGVVLGIGTGLGMHLPPVYAAQTRGEIGYGLVVGALRFFGDVGLTAGPVILGLIADAVTYRQALGINSFLMLGGIILFAPFAPKPSAVSSKPFAR
ncbi:MAG: MFS transporter [Thermodesulfobacteriota bacterium]